MKRIISFNPGGLGNRLLPLSSCYALAIQTARKCNTVWMPEIGCLAKFDELFCNDIEHVEFSDILNCGSVSFYVNSNPPFYNVHGDVMWEVNLYKLPVLKEIYDRYGAVKLSSPDQILQDQNDTILVLSNKSFNCPPHLEIQFFNDLKPIESVRTRIIDYCEQHTLDKSVVGVHIRGTDFNNFNIQNYINQIENEIKAGNEKFFICSDAKEHEDTIKDKFGDKIMTYSNKSYITKHDPKKDSWEANIHRSVKNVQDALIDVYLLSKTNIKIYNDISSFTKIAMKLGGQI